MQSIIDRTIAEPRLLAWLFSAFAALALLVAGIGVYAVTSYAVGRRTAEFGIRIALGARRADVLALVLRGGLVAIAAGLISGTLAAIFVARLTARLLFATPPLDPVSLLAGGLAMGAAALVATLLPAGRAARVDPLTALRD
jgi:ABC-type antimicrobial peptide transport system permease subunit